MLKTNIPKLKGLIVEKGITQEQLAKMIDMDSSTFSRKISSSGLKFSIGEVHKLAAALNLSQEEAVNIFLYDNSH